MIDRNKIENIVEQALAETGIFLVEIQVSRSNVIQVYIDHRDGVNLDQCVALHRTIEEQLDRDLEDYELQVSSPGLGQPLRVFPQYLKLTGSKLEVTLNEGDILRGNLLEARPATETQAAALVLKLIGTKRKPAPEEPVTIELDKIKTAREEIDFKM